jgi:hypothetical protein
MTWQLSGRMHNEDSPRADHAEPDQREWVDCKSLISHALSGVSVAGAAWLRWQHPQLVKSLERLVPVLSPANYTSVERLAEI